MKKLLIVMMTGSLMTLSVKTNAQNWSLIGNAGTNPATDFIGTTDAKVLKIKTNNQVRMYIKTNGDVGVGTSAPTSKLDVNGVITATGGKSSDWNSAFTWGNHALAGYLSSFTEIDPKVGANVTNFVSKWDGSALVGSNIFNSGNNFGLNTSTMIGSANFVVQSPNASGYGGMYLNQTGAGLIPFYGYAVNGASSCWTSFDQTSGEWGVYNSGNHLYLENDGDMRLGSTTTTTDSKLEILGKAGSTSSVVNVTGAYIGNFDVRGINSASITNPGYGYGVSGTGGYVGVSGAATATTYAGNAYGVFGVASGSTAGTRIGVYGSASGAATSEANWGGYFPTKTYSSEIRVGTLNGATGFIACIGGKLIAEEVRVELEASWPDYVFDADYNLMPLEQLKKEINQHKHLPGIPSAAQIEEQGGVDLGAMQTKLVEKVEELTLYIIQLKEQNDKLQATNENLQVRMSAIENNK